KHRMPGWKGDKQRRVAGYITVCRPWHFRDYTKRMCPKLLDDAFQVQLQASTRLLADIHRDQARSIHSPLQRPHPKIAAMEFALGHRGTRPPEVWCSADLDVHIHTSRSGADTCQA